MDTTRMILRTCVEYIHRNLLWDDMIQLLLAFRKYRSEIIRGSGFISYIAKNARTEGYERLLEMCIHHTFDIDCQSPIDGSTPLMCASKFAGTSSTDNAVKLLINAGADLNIQDNTGMTALTHAVANMHASSTFDTIKALSNAGADHNIKDSHGNTPIHYAIPNKIDSINDTNVAVTKLLLANGANPNIKYGSYDMNIMHVMAMYGRNEHVNNLLKLLIDAGADVNINTSGGYIPLTFAAAHTLTTSSEDVVQMLLDAGADPNAHKRDARSPLFEACYYINRSTVNTIKMLLDAGANVNYMSGYEQQSPLMAVVEAIDQQKCYDVAKILLDAGADPWGTSEASPYSFACQHEMKHKKLAIDVIKLIVSYLK